MSTRRTRVIGVTGAAVAAAIAVRRRRRAAAALARAEATPSPLTASPLAATSRARDILLCERCSLFYKPRTRPLELLAVSNVTKPSKSSSMARALNRLATQSGGAGGGADRDGAAPDQGAAQEQRVLREDLS